MEGDAQQTTEERRHSSAVGALALLVLRREGAPRYGGAPCAARRGRRTANAAGFIQRRLGLGGGVLRVALPAAAGGGVPPAVGAADAARRSDSMSTCPRSCATSAT